MNYKKGILSFSGTALQLRTWIEQRKLRQVQIVKEFFSKNHKYD